MGRVLGLRGLRVRVARMGIVARSIRIVDRLQHIAPPDASLDSVLVARYMWNGK
jgi:hypothetical protein